MTIDQDKLGELLGRFVGDLGATMAAGNIVIGHRLGLYRGLATGPATPEELAAGPAPIPGTPRNGCAVRPPVDTSLEQQQGGSR